MARRILVTSALPNANGPIHFGGKSHRHVHHWLIVSLFTAFNIALLFIYRKRPDATPCEV